MSIINQLLTENFILQADSYKIDHFAQLPAGVQWVQSSIVPRKPNKHTSHIVVSGVQYLARYFASVRISIEDVLEAELEAHQMGYEFNTEGWMDIATRLGGKLPLRIDALPDGTVVRPNTAIVTFLNTDSRHAWLPSFCETVAQCIIWKFTTVASISRAIFEELMKAAIITGSDTSMVQWKLHNFGDRGADAPQAAAFAGIAHAQVFSGSDSLKTNRNIKTLFNTVKPYLSSVEATEHSTMCANSDAKNRNDYGAAVMAVNRLEAVVKRVKDTGIGIPVFSCVIDTYDSHRFVRDFVGSEELKNRIINSGGKLVLRPDSGDPLVEPFEILQIASEVFGYTVNEKGFKVLPPYIGVLQGDGINQESIPKLLARMIELGWALDNILFGMGGGLTHEAGRDEFSFSQKATAMSFDNDPSNIQAWVNLKKEPITDLGKTSLTGYIINVREDDGVIKSINRSDWLGRNPIVYNTRVYEDGIAYVNDVNFDDVKARSIEGIEFA